MAFKSPDPAVFNLNTVTDARQQIKGTDFTSSRDFPVSGLKNLAPRFRDVFYSIANAIRSKRVSNEAKVQSDCQGYLNFKKVLNETMRSYSDRAWRLASSLLEALTESQVKPHVIKGLPSKLHTDALLPNPYHSTPW